METDEHGRVHPPATADEVTTLRGFLDYQRQTLAWKCRDVPAEGLRATTAATSMTLGGLLKHMALVEDSWFTRTLLGQPMPDGPWTGVDWDDDPDWEWRTAAQDDPAELRALWEAACARSDVALDAALATDDGLHQVAARGDDRGPSLRWILVHMIEEYARHNGHADLLREAWDGGAIGE